MREFEKQKEEEHEALISVQEYPRLTGIDFTF